MVQTDNPDVPFIVQNLGTIHRSAFRMNRLIEDLLTSTRIEAGQLRVQPRECDVVGLIEEFDEVIFPLLSGKSIQLICSIGPDLPKALADADRVIQVLSNLVGNAVKYTPVGAAIALSVTAYNRSIQFSVKDSGPGIPENELPQIFDQYWQGQHHKGGSGLGLYIAKALVEAHGGRIWIESVVGEGTTVFFTVPVVLPRGEMLPEKRAS
jgi:signal transduction histidine kinase